jgi:hypothetical protein
MTIFMVTKTPDGIVDLCSRVEKILPKPWKFILLGPEIVMLVKFYDAGITDHPLREAGGGADGKAELKWYERRHEVVGIGDSPVRAAYDILSGGKGARLVAMSVPSLQDGRKHLVFKSLDTGEIQHPGGGRWR